MPIRWGRRLMALLTIVATVFASLFIALATAPSASASDGRAIPLSRANQLTWQKGAGATEAEFRLTGSWRCTDFFNPCIPRPGQSFYAGTIVFGDGTSKDVQFENLALDPGNDRVTAKVQITHTYPSDGPFTAYFDDCCRLASSNGHINNPNGVIRYETLVDFSKTTASPVALVDPIVDCEIEAVCRFTVPAADPDGQPLAWRLAMPSEAGGLSQPTGAAIDPATGQYSWDATNAMLSTTGSTLYSTQVMVENVVGGDVISRTAVDFFIRLAPKPANPLPEFIPPTPADGAIISATQGTPLTINVAASHPDAGDLVTTEVTSVLPSGATYIPTNGNPATGVFNWTPTNPGDYHITFSAQHERGVGAALRIVIIRVAAANPAEIQCRAAKARGPGTTVDGRKVVLGTAGSGNQIVLSNGSGNMKLSGGSGDDLLCAWGGNKVLDGGSGHDTLVVMSGANNRLIGGAGDDTLIGFAADTFDGGTGRNTITKK